MNDLNVDIKDSVQSNLARNTAVAHKDPVSIVESEKPAGAVFHILMAALPC